MNLPQLTAEQSLDTAQGIYASKVSPGINNQLDMAAAGQQTCYSARGCTGKVLSHRDRHNCKVKSHGKSWEDQFGTCFNL
jgi:hypothetical protein